MTKDNADFLARAFAAARYVNEGGEIEGPEVASSSRDPSLGHGKAVRHAAYKFDVSTGTLARARIIIDHGTPELERAVMNGRYSLSEAANQVRPPRKKRDKGKKAKQLVKKAVQSKAPIRTEFKRVLTREEVDPEFKGTAIEFVDKYGHVQLRNALELATDRFNIFAIDLRYLAKTANQRFEQTVDGNWLREPKPADVHSVRQSIVALKQKIEEAERLLAIAEKALAALH